MIAPEKLYVYVLYFWTNVEIIKICATMITWYHGGLTGGGVDPPLEHSREIRIEESLN